MMEQIRADIRDFKKKKDLDKVTLSPTCNGVELKTPLFILLSSFR